MSKSIISVLRASEGLDDYSLYKSLVTSGVDLVNFDDRIYCWHDAPTAFHRFARRLSRGALAKAFDEQLMYYLNSMRPSVFIFFKASSISLDVIKLAKSQGTKTIAIYPDLDPAVHGASYVKTLAEADILFHTKPNLIEYFSTCINRNSSLIGPFYDPTQIGVISDPDYSIGVSFIGHHSKGKEESLWNFAARYEGTLSIFGDRWTDDMFAGCQGNVKLHPALYGKSINEIYRRSICVLGLLTDSVGEHSHYDEVTSRTISVPSYGGLLLHKRTPSAADFFEDNDDLLFHDTDDLLRKVENLKLRPLLRLELASLQQRMALQAGTNSKAFVEDIIST